MKFNSRNDILLTFRKFNQFFFPDIFKIFPDIYHDIIIHRSFILFYLSLNPTCSLYAYNSLILKYRFF